MKFKYSTIAISALSIFIFSSCEKNETLNLAPTTNFENAAGVKIVHASAYTVNNAIQLKIDDVRVSSNITYSYPFPGGGLNTGGNSDMDYLLTKAAAITVGMSIPKKGTNVDSVSLFSGTTPALEVDKYYDIFLSDTLTNTKMLVVEENLAPVDTSVTRFRFANLMPNLPSADLYFGNEKVASNIAYNTASAEFLIPKDSSARWAIRAAGALPTTAAIAYYPTGATAVHIIPFGRAMTVYARGYSGATGTRAPAVSLFYNKYYK